MRTNVPGGIHLVAAVAQEEEVVVGRLGHGQHPENLLASGGFRAEEALRADLSEEGSLELAYRVSRASGIRQRIDDVLRDPDIRPDDVGEPHQRVAAYAVVTSERGVLLTQFNEQTHVAGEWGLPGGGLDTGESPVGGVLREVWEETGLGAADIGAFFETDIVNLFHESSVDGVWCEVVFAARVRPDAAVTISHEHDDVRWVTPAAAHELVLWPAYHRAIEQVEWLVANPAKAEVYRLAMPA
jgi:8-oxo-dGTP pyrophosphatase MutT (NUDIX family)